MTKLESPIEEMYWQAGIQYGLDEWLIPQYKVCCSSGNNYRLDFAVPDLGLAIELDGYEYHSKESDITRDNRRDFELQADGWYVIRFTGRQIYNNVEWCIKDTLDMIDILLERSQPEVEEKESEPPHEPIIEHDLYGRTLIDGRQAYYYYYYDQGW